MKIPLQKFLQSALACAVISYSTLPGMALTTTTVDVAGFVRQAPEKTGHLLPQWLVGIYLDEVPSDAALCQKGATDDQGQYMISVKNLAHVQNIWVLNENL